MPNTERGHSPSRRPCANTKSPPPETTNPFAGFNFIVEPLSNNMDSFQTCLKTLENSPSRLVDMAKLLSLLTTANKQLSTKVDSLTQNLEALKVYCKQRSSEIVQALTDVQDAQGQNLAPTFASVAATNTPPPAPKIPQTPMKDKISTPLTTTYTNVQCQLIVQLTTPPPASVTDNSILLAYNNALTFTTVRSCLSC